MGRHRFKLGRAQAKFGRPRARFGRPGQWAMFRHMRPTELPEGLVRNTGYACCDLSLRERGDQSPGGAGNPSAHFDFLPLFLSAGSLSMARGVETARRSNRHALGVHSQATHSGHTWGTHLDTRLGLALAYTHCSHPGHAIRASTGETHSGHTLGVCVPVGACGWGAHSKSAHLRRSSPSGLGFRQKCVQPALTLRSSSLAASWRSRPVCQLRMPDAP